MTDAIDDRLEGLLATLETEGANLRLVWPDGDERVLGDDPAPATVRFHGPEGLRALRDRDHLALAEAYLEGAIEVDGDLREVIRVTDHLDVAPLRRASLRFWLRAWLDRRRFHQETVAFHYEQAPGFFLPWLGKHRCYTHGLYDSPEDSLGAAHERKLEQVIHALGLSPGMRVLDVGMGWGAFVEFAAEREIAVHGITLAQAQLDFVRRRLDERRLAGSVERVDFADHAPEVPYDAVVFMGSLEHIPDYRHVSRFLSRHLAPGGRVYADFVSSPEGRLAGAFLRRHIFPGASSYVDRRALRRSFERAGLVVEGEYDDTDSYAWTVRDWALALDEARPRLAAEFGERPLRAFSLYLWSAWYFLETRRTEGWRVIAGRPDERVRGEGR